MAAHFSLIFLYLFLLFLTSQAFEFVYNGFNQTNLILDGSTIIENGALELTNNSKHVIGHAFFPEPIQIKNSSSSSANASSFSVYFVFSIVPSGNKKGGYGLAFTLSPSTKFIGGEGDHFLGILNSSNDNDSSNHLFFVEFDTVNGYKQDSDSDGNHVGLNINSMDSLASDAATYYVNKANVNEEIELESGEPIQAWIDYDGLKKVVNVTISPLSVPKPIRPLISEAIDLSSVVLENMYAGFSAATGEKTSSHYVLGCSFRLNGVAGPLDLSRLPTPPVEGNSSASLHPVKKALISTFSVLLFLMVVALISILIYRRRMKFEVLEEWELENPHRFRYKDLYDATRGFRVSHLIGVGGFGEVYKGVLPITGAEVAVKKVSNKSLQGIREFAAEIESLGRLRHKNLVNLQGWCKYKNDLLLIYDYVPNGSLDSLLYNSKNDVVLTWEQRFNIVKGVAAGLLYLHEEWEQVVIHRDVKSSNVLIDNDMNARLGDFGLARLYDHGKNSHTTKVVGTIGYIAPELTRIGKAATSSDVFAYGILLLEVASGRSPISYISDEHQVILVDWVIECLQLERILDVVDEKLNSIYAVEEMELVLGLGLLCSHPKPEARPSMRQVLRYLNGDEMLPVFDKLSAVGSRTMEDIYDGLSSVGSRRTIVTTSYSSSSTGKLSYSSFTNAR